MASIFQGPDGAELRRLLVGTYTDRATAWLAGDYLKAGHRVGVSRALALMDEHRAVVEAQEGKGASPAKAAASVASIKGFAQDGALGAAIKADAVYAEPEGEPESSPPADPDVPGRPEAPELEDDDQGSDCHLGDAEARAAEEDANEEPEGR